MSIDTHLRHVCLMYYLQAKIVGYIIHLEPVICTEKNEKIYL